MTPARLSWLLVKLPDAHGLTAWEASFLDGLVERHAREGDALAGRLTERQEEVLERIAAERVD